jgi:hypothetical protein
MAAELQSLDQSPSKSALIEPPFAQGDSALLELGKDLASLRDRVRDAIDGASPNEVAPLQHMWTLLRAAAIASRRRDVRALRKLACAAQHSIEHHAAHQLPRGAEELAVLVGDKLIAFEPGVGASRRKTADVLVVFLLAVWDAARHRRTFVRILVSGTRKPGRRLSTSPPLALLVARRLAWAASTDARARAFKETVPDTLDAEVAKELRRLVRRVHGQAFVRSVRPTEKDGQALLCGILRALGIGDESVVRGLFGYEAEASAAELPTHAVSVPSPVVARNSE